MTPSPRGAFPSPPLSRPFTADFLPDGRALDTTRGSLVLAVFHEAYTTASPGPNYGKRCREERDRQIGWAGLQDSARSHPAKSARVGRNGKEGLARTQGPGPLPDRSTQGSALGKGDVAHSFRASTNKRTNGERGKWGREHIFPLLLCMRTPSFRGRFAFYRPESIVRGGSWPRCQGVNRDLCAMQRLNRIYIGG